MKESLQKVADRALLFALAVSILGALFKMLHFAGGNYMLVIGLGSLALVALVKNALELTLNGILTGITIAVWSIAFLLRIMHFPYGVLLSQIGIVLLCIWGINYFLQQRNSE